MITYINYTRNLGFEEDPNYDYLRGLFRKIMESHTQQFDFIFDWTKAGYKKPISINLEQLQLDKIKEKNENVKETEKETIALQPSYNRLGTINTDREIQNKRSKEMTLENKPSLNM